MKTPSKNKQLVIVTSLKQAFADQEVAVMDLNQAVAGLENIIVKNDETVVT